MAMMRPIPTRKCVRFAPGESGTTKQGWRDEGIRDASLSPDETGGQGHGKDDAGGGEGWVVGPAGYGQGKQDQAEHEPEAAQVVYGGLPARSTGHQEEQEQDGSGDERDVNPEDPSPVEEAVEEGAPHWPNDAAELGGGAEDAEGGGSAAGGKRWPIMAMVTGMTAPPPTAWMTRKATRGQRSLAMAQRTEPTANKSIAET